jgi:hypothetical protein
LLELVFVNSNIQASIDSMRLNILLFLSLALIWTGCVQENRYDSLQGKTLEEIQEIYPPQDNKTVKLGIAFGGGGVRGICSSWGDSGARGSRGSGAEIVTWNLSWCHRCRFVCL